MKPLNTQHLFNNPKSTAFIQRPKKIQQLWQVPKKIQILEIQNPKNTPLIPVCEHAKSTPWDSS